MGWERFQACDILLSLVVTSMCSISGSYTEIYSKLCQGSYWEFTVYSSLGIFGQCRVTPSKGPEALFDEKLGLGVKELPDQ